MALKTPNGSWRAQAMLRGQRHSQNFRTKALAEAQERLWRDGIPVVPKQSAPAPKTTLESVYLLFRDSRAKVELADSTLAVLACRWRHIAEDYGARLIEEISEADCLALRSKLAAKFKASYANLVLELFRTLTRLATRQGLITVDPWAYVKRIPTTEQAFGYWTPDQRDKFLAAARKIDRGFAELVTVAVHTGLRWGELYALEARHLDLDSERPKITVSANFRPTSRQVVETTKTKTIGSVPINPAAMEVLRRRAKLVPEGRLFKPSLLEGAKDRIEKIAKAAGVARIRFHDLRHTFASCLCLSGVDIYTVQRLMRHSSIQTTQRYAHLCESHLALAAAKLCGKTGYPEIAPPTQFRLVGNAQKTENSSGYAAGPLVKWSLQPPLRLVR